MNNLPTWGGRPTMHQYNRVQYGGHFFVFRAAPELARGLRIPRFQRELVLDTDYVTRLIESAIRGFALGHMVTYQRAPGRPTWLLDGQHRLLGIAAALGAIEVPGIPEMGIDFDRQAVVPLGDGVVSLRRLCQEQIDLDLIRNVEQERAVLIWTVRDILRYSTVSISEIEGQPPPLAFEAFVLSNRGLPMDKAFLDRMAVEFGAHDWEAV